MKIRPLRILTMALVVWAHGLTASDIQIGILSEGACWYESKEALKLVSFNEKVSYSGVRKIVEQEMASLVPQRRGAKLQEIDLALHCGGAGLSLVGKILIDDQLFCVWGKLENAKWVSRSVGALSEDMKKSDLCDGYKWGEFILGTNGANSAEYLNELQGGKWSSMIKEVSLVSQNTYKVIVTHEYEFRESEVMNQIEENFTGKYFIRFLEFNEYRHPVGESVTLK